jgi:hypothetical protein
MVRPWSPSESVATSAFAGGERRNFPEPDFGHSPAEGWSLHKRYAI